MTETPDSWKPPQKILVILAHPDDPEFFCGATLARWARAGHEIHYFLLTCGDKGGNGKVSSAELCQIRQVEQKHAAKVIGVKSVEFLGLEDGYLVPTLELRREVVRAIRRYRPDILVTCDPTHLYVGERYINHPDHRYAGQVVLDAVFPAAGNPLFFPELLQEENLPPHTPREIWVSLAENPNVILDVTESWEIKIQALKEHKSQIDDPQKLEEQMRARYQEGSTAENPRYQEQFWVIRYERRE